MIWFWKSAVETQLCERVTHHLFDEVRAWLQGASLSQDVSNVLQQRGLKAASKAIKNDISSSASGRDSNRFGMLLEGKLFEDPLGSYESEPVISGTFENRAHVELSVTQHGHGFQMFQI